VRNPQVLLNSLNSFALDEAALHIPVRAAENKVFVVAANKVGALVPEHMTEVVAARLKIAVSFLQGAGESQIVAPNGEVLAKAPLRGEAVIFADIDPTLADDKCRPDGTDILKSRRPMLYHPIGVDPKQNSDGGNAGKAGKIGAEKVVGAVIQPSQLGHGAIEEVCHAIVNAVKANAKMIVLPELFHLEGGRVADVYAAEAQSQHMCEALQHTLQAAPDDCYVACTLVEHNELGWQHVGVLLNRDGVALRQAQLHMAGRHAWVTALGARLEVVDTAWGRVALVVGNDAIYPETFRIAALQHTEVVAVPATILETWESTLGFAERAAENRMNVLVADRAESAIYAVTEDFTLWTEWKNRPFDGNINTPVVTSANHNVLTLSDIYPAATHNKMVSQRTDVLDGRPWALAEPIIS
jgi:predicted amidohydrolase